MSKHPSTTNLEFSPEFYSLIESFNPSVHKPTKDKSPENDAENAIPHQSQKSQFIDKYMHQITQNLLTKYQRHLQKMNEKGIFDENTNKTRLMFKMREDLKRIDWDAERRKAEKLFNEKNNVTAYEILDAYLKPERTKDAMRLTSEATDWRKDSVYLMGKNDREYKRIKREDEKMQMQENPQPKKIPKYMEQTLKQIEERKGSPLRPTEEGKSAPMHALIRQVSRFKMMQARFRNQRSSGSSRSTVQLNKKTKEEDYDTKRVKLEQELELLKLKQRQELERQYKNVPDVNYSLSELMEKYVEQSTDAQWEADDEVFKSLAMDEDKVKITNAKVAAQNKKQKEPQISQDRIVKESTHADRTSLRAFMLEDQDKHKDLEKIQRQMEELKSKKNIHISTAYDHLQAEAYDSVEEEKIEKQRQKLELAHGRDRVLFQDETHMNEYGSLLMRSEPIIETSIETVKRLEQVCDILERCIVYLCAEFQKKKSYHEEEMPEEVAVMQKICLSCMRTLPIMASRRAKRSWTKAAEIIFCWELNLDNPFSVHNEKHIERLAEHYVAVHYDIDLLLEYFVESYRKKLQRDVVRDKRSRHILKTVLTGEAATEDEEELQAHIGRKKAMEALLPGLDMLAHWDNLDELEVKIQRGEYEELKKIFFDRPSTYTIGQESEDDILRRDKLLQKKKVLFVINNYVNYCNINIQRLFQKHVKHYKEEKLQAGFASLETDFQIRRRDEFQDREQLPIDLNTERLIRRRGLGRSVGFGETSPRDAADAMGANSSFSELRSTARSRGKTQDYSSLSMQRPATGPALPQINPPTKSRTRERVEEYVNIFDEWSLSWKEKFKKLDPKKDTHKAISEFRKQKDELLKRRHRDESESDDDSMATSKDPMVHGIENTDRIAKLLDSESTFKNSYEKDYERRQRNKSRKSAQGRYPFSSTSDFQKFKKDSKYKNRDQNMELNPEEIGALRDENGILLSALQVLQLLEQVWDDLLYPYDKKILLFEKYNNEPFTQVKVITPVYLVWRRAANYVIEREVVLTKLREFEKEASDPMRFFSGQSSVKRLQEEKKRTILFKQVCKFARYCEREARKLKREFNEDLEYQSENYLEKMKTDYTNLLFLLESKRLQKTEFSSYEELMEALQEKARKANIGSVGAGVEQLHAY